MGRLNKPMTGKQPHINQTRRDMTRMQNAKQLQQQQAAANIATQLIITLDKSGNMNLSGPLQDKILCYGLLENAKDAIRNIHQAQADRAKLQPQLTQVESPIASNNGSSNDGIEVPTLEEQQILLGNSNKE